MADDDALLRALAGLVCAGRDWNRVDANVHAERAATALDLSPHAGPETVAVALREALGMPGPRPADSEQPLTCVRCWNSPASRLPVVHWRTETIRMLCAGCAAVDAEDARDLPGFRMATLLTIGTVAAVSGT